MSEEILKALMQLFALIIKQDGGVEEKEKKYVQNFLGQQLASENVTYYYSLFEQHAGLEDKSAKLTSVTDSVRIMGICRKINKTLHQNQKVIVLLRLYELVNSDKKFTQQRMAIISTVADVFKIDKSEAVSIEKYVITNSPTKFLDQSILVVNDQKISYQQTLHLQSEKLDGHLIFLRVLSVGLYFIRYTGTGDLFLNGLSINPSRIYLFANGSTIKLPKGKPMYYSDVASHYMQEGLMWEARLPQDLCTVVGG